MSTTLLLQDDHFLKHIVVRSYLTILLQTLLSYHHIYSSKQHKSHPGMHSYIFRAYTIACTSIQHVYIFSVLNTISRRNDGLPFETCLLSGHLSMVHRRDGISILSRYRPPPVDCRRFSSNPPIPKSVLLLSIKFIILQQTCLSDCSLCSCVLYSN